MLKRAWILSLCLPALLPAALLRIEVSERSDVLDGKPFAASGPYERIVGKAYFAVDPNLPANRIITDIAQAPRNDAGLVEFSADFYCLKPRDPAHGNHAVLFEVSNRGGRAMVATFDLSGAPHPGGDTEFGDGFLLDQGYTLVWLGWEFDVPPGPGLLHLYTPAVKGISGLVRSEIIVDRREIRQSLGDRAQIGYAVSNPDDPNLTLTVRDRADGPRHSVPRDAWHIEGATHIAMPAGFEPGRIYELVYKSQDPPVVGLGPAAVRDLISFLKYGIDADTILGDQHAYIKRAYGFGISQSGRFLRTFVYYGFNQDERGRKVFDGIMAHVAGAGRGSFNHRFAQPSRDAHPFLNTFYPTDIFPFTDLAETDPDTGITDGILARATPPILAPRIFYTNTSYEYYGRSASLIHTTIDGQHDAPLPRTTRIYFLAGCQHGPSAFPPKRGEAQNLPNPNNWRWPMRALLVAMDQWVKDGVEPPPSQYPRIADGTLTALADVHFPKISGVAFPKIIQQAWHVDYGEEFRTAGIVTIEPPKVGRPFPMRLPQVDADGNETSGIRMPATAVPLATYTGWNLRAPQIGAPDELYSMAGSFIPFARTKADRARSGDPRLSVEERYPGKKDFLDRVQAAAHELVQKRFLLEGDVPLVVERASAEWDLVTRP
ncbi:MAG TPA: alpha/beta hydrolase domain-containing protein [Bryobacteraceae bacterium]|nr:alpha/beta hydrolase domain-containing protein [Bryobacteraceae bacterium]